MRISDWSSDVCSSDLRFYPSIYTHSIAWAILGKAHVKASHHTTAFKGHFANHLDKAVGAGQEGQTIGIPIGPDTSRIIAELVAVVVEEIAKARSEEHTSELQSLMRISYAVISLKNNHHYTIYYI